MSLPLTITDKAKARLIELAAQKDDAYGVKLFIATGKGCGGNEYQMDYMSEESEGFDKIDVSDDVGLYVPVTDSFHMFGIEIDFIEEDLGNSKFTFMNPNEVGRCGCGETFSLDRDVKGEDIDPTEMSCYREF